MTTSDSSMRPVSVILFGRAGGPLRFVLGVIALGALLTLTVTVARLDLRLGVLQETTQATLSGARQNAAVHDRFTRRLGQLDDLARGAHLTLEQTRALRPVLAELKDAVGPLTSAVATGRSGGERSAEQLNHIRGVLLRLRAGTTDLAGSAGKFDRQGTDLLGNLDDLVGDLRASLEAAERIDAALPLPRLGGR